MKEYLGLLFLCLAIFIAACESGFSGTPLPADLPPFLKWEGGSPQGFCGEMLIGGRRYMNGDDTWIGFNLWKNPNPFVISHSVRVRKSRTETGVGKIEYWLDLNSDGIMDQYFPNHQQFEKQYSDNCKIIDKLIIKD